MKVFITKILVLCLLFPFFSQAANTGNSSGYAWGEETGYISFSGENSSSDYGVTVGDTELTGYSWGELTGYISFNCSNTSSCATIDYKVVNDGTGVLSGYAWSEKLGYINFNDASSNYAVTIDSSGNFQGYAWSELTGYISLSGSNYQVSTTWTEPLGSGVALQMTVGDAIAVTCDSTAPLGTLSPGSPAQTQLACSVITNATGGYDLLAKRDDANSTLDHTDDDATNIADKTAWNSLAPNAEIWSGTGLGFRVKQLGTTTELYNDTWWGDDDSLSEALFAGLPSSYQNIATTSTYSPITTDIIIETKLDIPTAQRAGLYDGTITIQTITKP